MDKLKSIFILLALMTSGVSAVASPASGVDQCTLATMKGAYLYAQDGIILGKSADKNQPFAQAGREYYDGKGGHVGDLFRKLQWNHYSRELQGYIYNGSKLFGDCYFRR